MSDNRDALTERLKQLRAQRGITSPTSNPNPGSGPSVTVSPSSPESNRQRPSVPTIPTHTGPFNSNHGLVVEKTSPRDKTSPRSPRRTTSIQNMMLQMSGNSELVSIIDLKLGPSRSPTSPNTSATHSPNSIDKKLDKDEVLKRLQVLREKKGKSPNDNNQSNNNTNIQSNNNNIYATITHNTNQQSNISNNQYHHPHSLWSINSNNNNNINNPLNTSGTWKKSPSLEFSELLNSTSDLLFETDMNFMIELSGTALLKQSSESNRSNIDDEPYELPLPSTDWNRRVDVITLSPYYINEITGISTTTHPHYLYGPYWTGGNLVDDSLLNFSGNWNRYFDQETNCYFYYNNSTGETSWLPPNSITSQTQTDSYTKRRSMSTRAAPPQPNLSNSQTNVTPSPSAQKRLLMELQNKRSNEVFVRANLQDNSNSADTNWENYLKNFNAEATDSIIQITDDIINTFSSFTITKGTLGYDMSLLFNDGLTSCKTGIFSEISVNRPLFGWKPVIELPDDLVQLLFSIRNIEGIPHDLVDTMQLSVSIWQEDQRLSNEFVVNFQGHNQGSYALPKNKSSTLFTNIPVSPSTTNSSSNTSNFRSIDVMLVVNVDYHPIIQQRIPVTIINSIKNIAFTHDSISIPFGYSIDYSHKIKPLNASLEITLGAYHSIYKEEQYSNLFTITRSISLSVQDLITSTLRNDIYLSIDIEQLITQCATKKQTLPSHFKLMATVVNKEGDVIMENKLAAGTFPENFNFENFRIPLPKAALEDYSSHLIIQIVSSDSSELTIPQISKFVTPSYNNVLSPTSILTNIQKYSNTIAFAVFMLYTNPGQLRSDNKYELLLYQGRPPSKKSPSDKITCNSDLTPACKLALHETPNTVSIGIPNYLNNNKKSDSTVMPMGLSIQFRVVSSSLLEDDSIQVFLDSGISPKDQLKDLVKSQGNVFQGSNIYDIFKFYSHILARISKLYRYQLSNKIITELEPLWNVVCSIVTSMSYPEANDPVLHSKFIIAIRESFEGTEFIKDYLDFLLEKKLKQFMNGEKSTETSFIMYSFCCSYLLAGILINSMDLFDTNYIQSKVQSLLELFAKSIRFYGTQSIRSMISRHFRIIYPYLLTVCHVNEVLEVIKQLVFINESDLPQYELDTLTTLLNVIIHVFQYDANSKFKKNELYIQIALLPSVTKLLTLLLYTRQFDNKGSSPRSLLDIETLNHAITELMSCVYSVVFPLIWFNATQRNALSTLKSLFSQLLPCLWSPILLLLDIPLQSPLSSIRDGLQSIIISSFCSILSFNSGQYLQEIMARFNNPQRLKTLVYKFSIHFYKFTTSPPFSKHGFHRLILKIEKESFSFIEQIYQLFIVRFSIDESLSFDHEFLDSLFQYLVALPIVWINPPDESDQASAAAYYDGFDQLRVQGLQLISNICKTNGKITSFMVDTIASSLLKLYLESQDQPTVCELALSSFYSLLIVDFLAHKNLKQIKKALLISLSEYRGLNENDKHSIELLQNELSKTIEDPTILLPQLKNIAKNFSNELFLQHEIKFIRKANKLVILFRNLLEDYQELEYELHNEMFIDVLQHLIFHYSSNYSVHVLEFIDKLVQLQHQSQNYREYAYSLLYQYEITRSIRDHAQSRSGNKLLSSSIDSTQLMLPVEGLCESIEEFNKVEDWEGALSACNRLVEYYETEEFNYNKVTEFLLRSVEYHKKISELPRISPLYYGMYFVGSNFPSRLDGKVFIYRLKENENFPLFYQRISSMFKEALILIPKDSLPNYKPSMAIQIFPVYPFVDAYDVVSHGNNIGINGSKNIIQFYSFHDIEEVSLKSNDHIKKAVDRWNSSFTPSYLLSGSKFEIPPEVRKSSSLPPAETPCYRSIYTLDPKLLGTSKRMLVSKISKSVIPGPQASIEWLNYQENKLKSICSIVSSVHKNKVTSTDLWCHGCKGQARANMDFNKMVAENSLKLSNESQQHLEDACGIVRWILIELLTPETDYVTGFRKIKGILEKNSSRESALHSKIKESISKAWVKEQKRCKEQNLPAPVKPSVDTLQVVTDPLLVTLTQYLRNMETTIAYALWLHQKLGNATEQEINEHEDLEVLFYNAFKL